MGPHDRCHHQGRASWHRGCITGFSRSRIGSFINVSSVSGLQVAPTTDAYSGTKFAARAISAGLRQEAGSKIRVTTICPRAVKTELAETISPGPKSASMRLRRPSSSPRISTSTKSRFGSPRSRHRPWATLCSVFGGYLSY